MSGLIEEFEQLELIAKKLSDYGLVKLGLESRKQAVIGYDAAQIAMWHTEVSSADVGVLEIDVSIFKTEEGVIKLAVREALNSGNIYTSEFPVVQTTAVAFISDRFNVLNLYLGEIERKKAVKFLGEFKRELEDEIAAMPPSNGRGFFSTLLNRFRRQSVGGQPSQ